MKHIKSLNLTKDNLPRLFFILSLCIVSFLYGAVTYQYKTFPHTLFEDVGEGIALLGFYLSEYRFRNYYIPTTETDPILTYDEEAAYPGLSLVSSVIANDRLAVQVIDMNGQILHQWPTDWFEIWPDATHIPPEELPQIRPGTNLHGKVLLENGDLIFNFEFLGLVKLDICGNVVWRLPYRTHHSIYQDEDGYLWVSGQINHSAPLANYPNYIPPFVEPTIIKATVDGEIISEISVLDLLTDNNLSGLLFMSSILDGNTTVTGDTLHLNDIETFPTSLEEGVFQTGDVMLSLRNINTVLIFRQADQKVTHLTIGEVVRQHDPDFIDGNTISIFDNNDSAPADYGHHSKIVLKSFVDDQALTTYYTGSAEDPFYTATMGKNQWLPNGNLLISESEKGRAFEVAPNGEIVWEYLNLIADGYIGRISEVQRLPSHFTPAFFAEKTQACGN